MAESYTARAILTATDKNFTKVFNTALGTANKLENSFKGGLGMGIAMGIGQKLFSSLANGLQGIVGGTIAAGSGFEAAMSQVQATMRVTDKTMAELNGHQVVVMDALREKAEELGKSTQFSAVQVGQAMNNMAMAGYDVQKIYDNIPTVLNLAAAGGLNLDYATQLVANGMAVMGDRCESAAQMADMLAVTASSAYGSVSEFGEGLLVAGGQAKICGLDLAETYTALGILGDAGMQGSEGGTQLRNALKNLYQPTDKAKKLLKQLGVETVDADGNMVHFQDVLQQLNGAMEGMTAGEKNDILSRIFDTRTLRAGNALLEQSGQRFTELHAKISACDGAAMEMANTVNDNLQGDMIKFSSAVEGLQDTIYKSLDGPMRMAVKAGIRGINLLTDMAEALGKKFEKAEPYITAITDQVGKFLDTSEGLKAIGEAFADIFTSKNIDPSDLSAAAAQAEKFGRAFDGGKLDKFKNKIKGISDGINSFLTDNKETISQVIHLLPMLTKGLIGLGLAKGVTGKLMPLGRGLASVADGISTTAGVCASGAGKVKDFTTIFGKKLGARITKEGGAFDKFGMKAQQALFKVEAATGRFDRNPPKLWQMVNSGKLGSAFGKFGKVAGAALKGYTDLAGLALKALAPGAMVGVILAGLGLVYQAFGSEIDQILQLVQTQGPTIITNLANALVSNIPALIASGAQLIGGLLETFTALAPSLVSAGVAIITSLVTGVGSALPTLVPQAVNAVGTLAVSIISNLPTLIAAGIQMLVGLAQGISNSIPMLISYAAQAVVGFIQGLSANLPTIIAGGIQIVLSLITGLIKAIPTLLVGAGEIIVALGKALIETDWGAVGMQIITAIKDGIVGGFTGFGDFLKGLITGDDAGVETGYQTSAQITSGIESGKAEMVAAGSAAGSETVDALMASFEGIDLSGMGTTAGASFTTPYITEMSTLPTEVGGTMTEMTTLFNQGATAATTAGKATGNGYVTGIQAARGSSTSAGTGLKNAALGAMNGGYGKAYSHGANIGQGLADGMRSKVGDAWDAANSLAEAADKAIHARAQIGSPSKLTRKYGEFIAEGLAVGMKDGTASVIREAEAMTGSTIRAMETAVNIPKMASSIKKAGSAVLESEQLITDERKNHFTIVVESVMDGRKVGEGVADYVDEAITKKNAREARKRGRA